MTAKVNVQICTKTFCIVCLPLIQFVNLYITHEGLLDRLRAFADQLVEVIKLIEAQAPILSSLFKTQD